MNYYLLDEITIPNNKNPFFETKEGMISPTWVEPINTTIPII